MPRIRQNADKYRKRDFEGRCRARMALMGIGDRELAQMVGMSHTTLWRRIREPGTMRVDELVRIVKALELGNDDVLGLVGMLGLKVVKK
jgi:hypothetical protein